MTTRIGLISDIHATPAPLKEALSIFKQQNANLILCPGDIAGYGDALEDTIDLLIGSQCKAILGNHEVWYLEKPEHADTTAYQYFNSLPHSLELDLEDRSLYMVHASPPDSLVEGIRLLDKKGKLVPGQQQYWATQLADFDYSILIVGHTHQVFAEQIGNTLVINPGSTAYNNSCAILNLPEMKVDFYALSNKKISTIWNWGSNQVKPG